MLHMDNKDFKIYVIIATSNNRTPLLINRALTSVYSQKDVNGENIEIIIVDDNIRTSTKSFSSEYEIIKEKVWKLRQAFSLHENQFKTFVIPNIRKQFFSGTGAWNTGIDFIKNHKNNNILTYTAMLDDDDEYKQNYLSECIKHIGEDTLAVFAPIIWKGPNLEQINYINKEELTQRHFFIENPGIQGSNMFIKSKLLEEIEGFDENLPSTTDRDLMIRLLDHIEKNYSNDKIVVLKEPLVIHYANGKNRVTDDKIKKTEGLDLFYKKYKHRFSTEDLLT